jgi:CHAT domain-containing protein/tetratricopeptide (TPR) repeat protein
VLLSTDKVTTIQLVISLVALGNAYINRIAGQRVENLDQALNIYSRAERIVIPLRNPERQAELFLNIAVAKRLRAQETVNIDLSDRFIDEGLKYSELALVNFRQVNARVMLSTVYCEQGTLYYNRSSDRAASLNQAVQCYQKALAVIQRTEAPMLWANTHDDLANALGERDHTQRADRINDLKCAVGHYQEALSVFRQDNYPQQWANVNNNLGATYLDLGNQVAAERCFKAALGVHTPDAFPGEAKLVAQNLGNLYFSQGQWQSAWEYYQIALQSSERQYQASEFDLGKQAEQSKRFLLTQRSAYTLIKLNQPGEALETLEHEKARLLNEHMQTRANPPGGVSHEHWKDYLECFDQVRNNKIQDYQINSQLSSIPDDRENRQKALLNLKRAVDTIRQEAPDFLQDMDLDAIRTILPNPQTALIAFCMTERGGFAIILTQCPDSVKVVELSDLTPRFVNHWLSGEVPDLDHRRQAAKTMESAPEPQPGSWLFACNNITNKDHQKNSFEALEQSLSVIGASLVEPILATIPDEIQSLMILPTGGLFLIPFHAAYLPKNGMRLLDIYKVSYIPSAKVLHHQLLPPAQPGSRCLLGIIASQASRLEFRGAMQEALLQLKTPGTSGYWNQVEVIEGSGCTEDNVFIEAKKASALHFYGHGVFNPRSPKDSCLHLTGDTRLTLEKMQANRTDLSSIRLLTLTACEAGQIDTAEVPEEYLSLAAGFMQLGIACVISPLWRVPEESSVLLMDAFYQFYTQGYSPSSALQAAQQKISSFTYADLAKTSLYAKIEVKDQCMTAANRHDFYCRMVRTKAEVRPFENPFYWAAFTVNGAG